MTTFLNNCAQATFALVLLMPVLASAHIAI